MSTGVQITGPIKPLATANPKFPVFIDTDGQGGLQSVATIADRDAILETFKKDGFIVYVQANLCYYAWNDTVAAWEFAWTSPAVNRQTAWAIDDATGNDLNSGLPGSPLKTIEEFNQRISPFGRKWVPLNGAVVTVGAGSYGIPSFDLAIPAPSPFATVVSFQCAESLGASITLSAVVNTNAATKVCGEVTTVGATDFVANKMYRSTSGAQAGALVYTLGQHASPKNFYVKQWFNYFTTGTAVDVAPGTTCQEVIPLVNFSGLQINVVGPGYCEFLSANFTGEVIGQAFDTGGTLNYVGCTYTGASSHPNYGEIYGSGVWWACNFLSGVVAMCLQFPIMEGCIVQAGCTIACYPGSILYLFQGNCFNGGQLTALQASAGIYINDNIQFENGQAIATGALSIQTAGAVTLLGGSLWSRTGATPYSLGVYMQSLCRLSVSNMAQLAIAATNEMYLSGHTLNYADGPISYDRAGVLVALGIDATSQTTTDLPFHGTYYVDPTFSGISNGTPTNPYKTYAAVFAAAVTAGITNGIIWQAPGTSVVENVTFPTTGEWEIAAQPGQGGLTTFITGNVDISATASARRAITNIRITGNLTGNCSAGTQRILFSGSTILGTTTLTQSGAGVQRVATRSGTSAAAVGGNIQACFFQGATIIAGTFWGSDAIFSASLSVAASSQFSFCDMPPVTSSAGNVDLWLLNCSNALGGSLAFTATGGGSIRLRPDYATMTELMRVGIVSTGTILIKALTGASNRTTPVSNVGTTPLAGLIPAGLMTIDACLTLLTTAGATGNAVLNVTYTDMTGTLVTEAVTTALNVAGAAGSKARGSLQISQNGATTVSYSITGITGAAGLTYQADVSLSQAS